MRSNLQRAADALLREMHDVTLEEFIRTKRAEGLSFRQVARELYLSTDHAVDVTPETVRGWAASADGEAA